MKQIKIIGIVVLLLVLACVFTAGCTSSGTDKIVSSTVSPTVSPTAIQTSVPTISPTATPTPIPSSQTSITHEVPIVGTYITVLSDEGGKGILDFRSDGTMDQILVYPDGTVENYYSNASWTDVGNKMYKVGSGIFKLSNDENTLTITLDGGRIMSFTRDSNAKIDPIIGAWKYEKGDRVYYCDFKFGGTYRFGIGANGLIDEIYEYNWVKKNENHYTTSNENTDFYLSSDGTQLTQKMITKEGSEQELVYKRVPSARG